jgi:hypothetical protein
LRSWNENLKKIGYILIVVFLMPVIWFLIAGSTSKRKVNPSWLERDVDTIEPMVFTHVDPFWRHERKEFEEILKKARSSIKRMHRMDFYLLVQPIFALLSDHESYVHFGMPGYMPVLPFRVVIRNGRIFAVSSTTHDIEDGDEIVEFDGMKISEFLNWIEKYVGAESRAQWEVLAEEFIFRLPSIQRNEKYRVRTNDGIKSVYSVPIAKYRERLKELGKLKKEFEVFKKNGFTVLKVRTFSLWGRDIQDFEDELKRIIRNSEKLIVDLRGNSGGSWGTMKKMVSYLINKEVSFERSVERNGQIVDETVKVSPRDGHFEGDLYVLVDERTLDEAYEASLLLSEVATVVGKNPDMGDFRFSGIEFKRLPSVGMYFTLSHEKVYYPEKLRVDIVVDESDEEYVKRAIRKGDKMLENLLSGVIR